MIFIGIDDTDTLDSRGTNQLARAIAIALEPHWKCDFIVRHQLLIDPRVPYTSKNGSASLSMRSLDDASVDSLIDTCQSVMHEWFIPGSDPGLCVTDLVPTEVRDFGSRCKTTLISQDEARELADRNSIYLVGLGGTNQGIVGALAAVGLAVGGNDGRIVRLGNFPDDMTGMQPVSQIVERGVRVREIENEAEVTEGFVDVGKRLRPNCSAGDAVLFVRRTPDSLASCTFDAIKLP